jgi:NAD(P)H-dependent flavin oxidoreductase YrpB (nitropropane dioxygenase family)
MANKISGSEEGLNALLGGNADIEQAPEEGTFTETIHTPLTELLGIKYPVMLAGMNAVATSELVAAVTNAGGIGTIGGLTMTPKMLQIEINELKKLLKDRNAPFGVDLAIPQIGGGARKTNHDYTHGKLDELTDIIIKEKAAIFVCAVGVPPKAMVDKLHAAGIPIMNMVGHPNHVLKALDAGVDMICAQGGEGGGHTGEVATSVLLPMCVDACRGRRSPLTGEDIIVVGGGGMFDGRSLAAALSLGASGVWVGTRFIACEETGAPKRHVEHVLKASVTDTTKTLIYSGRPLRTFVTPYVKEFETRPEEIKAYCDKGILPIRGDYKKHMEAGKPFSKGETVALLMGQVAGAVHDKPPAKQIVEQMVSQAIEILRKNAAVIRPIGMPAPASKL